jgi:hypothetical protein
MSMHKYTETRCSIAPGCYPGCYPLRYYVVSIERWASNSSSKLDHAF